MCWDVKGKQMEMEDQKKVNQYISKFQLIPHHSQPGNLMGDIFIGPEENVNENLFVGGKRSVTTAIYYMILEKAVTQFNHLKSVKYWQYCDGSPQHVALIDMEKNILEEVILGDPLIHADLAQRLNKKLFQIIPVLPIQWIGSRLVNQRSFSLITCTVTPGFDMRDFSVLTLAESKTRFPDLANNIEKFFNG